VDGSPRAANLRTYFLIGIALAGLMTALIPMTGEGFARTRRIRMRRPNLVPIAPATFHGPSTGTDPQYLFGGSAVIDGCTPDEIVRELARRCLRFDTVLANLGRGAFEVAYQLDPEHGLLTAHQHVYRRNGTFRSRYATQTEYHPTHAHFHIKNIYVAKLWRVDAKSNRIGRRPIARSDKNGFCPEDTAPVGSRPANRRYACFGAEGFGSNGSIQIVGISPGWSDIYPFSLPDQYIEIGDVPNGRYLFELEVDPNDVFVESAEDDNSACVLLRLKSVGVVAQKESDCGA
jgi:hypothetical protein